MIAIPTSRTKAKLVELPPIEVRARGDLVDQTVEISPAPGCLGEAFE
jgi:hypothetical protein